MKRSGIVDLPLHYGRAPPWLFRRMVKLAGGISDVIIKEYGKGELLKRLSDPRWFQALSCVLGYDWHSSGTTTVTMGALKEAIDAEHLGIAVCGGKGRASRKAQSEIAEAGKLFGLSSDDVDQLQYSSRITAKVDNACIQDGYQLYHHCFVLTEGGEWAVVQQGMRDSYARRYHWLSEDLQSLVEESHTGIACDRLERNVLDMTSRDSEEARETSVELANERPEKLLEHLKPGYQRTLFEFAGASTEKFRMPRRHAIMNLDLGKLGRKVVYAMQEAQPADYEELISIRGVGPKMIRALALISELIYGAKASWNDPAAYSFAHGGKDGIPYPVDKETYDRSILIIEEAVEEAKLKKKEKLNALKRLRDFVNST